MSEQTHVTDEGNFDWEARVDDDGRVWLSPSIGWKSGEVYEWLRHGQTLCEIADKAQEHPEEAGVPVGELKELVDIMRDHATDEQTQDCRALAFAQCSMLLEELVEQYE